MSVKGIKCTHCESLSEYNERPVTGSLVKCKMCQQDFMYTDVDAFLFSTSDEEEEEKKPIKAAKTKAKQDFNKENEFEEQRYKHKFEYIDDSDSEYEDPGIEEEDDSYMEEKEDIPSKESSEKAESLLKPTFKPKMTLKSIQQAASKNITDVNDNKRKLVIPSLSAVPLFKSNGFNIPEIQLKMDDIYQSSSEEEKEEEKREEEPEEDDTPQRKNRHAPLFSEEEEYDIPQKKSRHKPLFSDEEEYELDDDSDEEKEPENRKRNRRAIDDLFSDLEDEFEEQELSANESEKKKPKRSYTTEKFKYNRDDRRLKSELAAETEMLYERSKLLHKEYEGNKASKRKYKYVYRKDEQGNATYEKVLSDGEEEEIIPMIKQRKKRRSQKDQDQEQEQDVEDNDREKRTYRYGPKTGNKFNPFILFNTEYRKEVKAANPDLTQKMLSAAVAEAYQNLPLDEKEKWKEYARKKREEFTREQKADEMNVLNKRLKLPPTPYILWQKEEGPKIREANKDKPTEELGSWPKILSATWKSLSEEQKQPYFERSKMMREEFMLKHKDVHKAKMERMMQKARQTKQKNGSLHKRKVKEPTIKKKRDRKPKVVAVVAKEQLSDKEEIQ